MLYQAWFCDIYNALRHWVRKEVIDFPPYDEEAVGAQKLFEQFERAEFCSSGIFGSPSEAPRI
jgi:hypothetical protein